MPDFLIPPGLDALWTAALIALSAVTSFITASVGIGGGVILLAVMAVALPGAAIIPVHGAVQIGSNAGRTAVMLSSVNWRIVAPFLAGSLIGAGLGGLTVVQLPAELIKLGLAAFIL
ncbi:MAG: sulfite exporter TauE/SafE family protein [Pseudomonadota bacterium]